MPTFFPEGHLESAVQSEREAGMVYYPTLLVGLGGSGAQVLLRVKKLLTEQGDEGRNSLHRFLFLDTDRATFRGKPGLPPIEPREQCLIGVEGVEPVLRYPDVHAHIWRRFPKNALQETFIRNLTQGIGAGQIRSLGALAFAVDYVAIRRRFEEAFNELIQLTNRQAVRLSRPSASISEQVAVYIVGSLCGGTGSGCFIDAALLARAVCLKRQPKLVGFFLLPCAAYDKVVAGDVLQQDRMRANAYAALKELQFVLDAGAQERSQRVVYDYGNGNTLDLDPSDQLFNLVYLASDTNACGRLTTLDELFELTARAIFQDVGSPFGTNARSFESNNQVLAGVATCPVTNRKRLFGSFATSALVYPAERVARYCSYRALKEILSDYVLGQPATVATVDGLVTTFLQQHRLDDRGRNDQIIESLLHDPKRTTTVSSTTIGLGPSFGHSQKPKDFVSLLQRKWQEFEAEQLPAVKRVVETNLTVLLGEDQLPPRDLIGEVVKEFALQVAAQYNLATVCSVLEELDKVAANMRQELSNEVNEWFSTKRAALESDFHQRCDELSRVTWLKALGPTDERLKSLLVRIFNDRVDAELKAAAKPFAIKVLEVLSNRVRQVYDLCRSVVHGLESLAREAEAHSLKMQTHQARISSQFAVEIEVTKPGYESYYYKEHVDVGALFAKIVGRHTNRPGFYSWLLEAGSGYGVRSLGQDLGEMVYAEVAPPLKLTNLVSFVNDPRNADHVDDSLDTKLDLVFELSQPFWDAEAVHSAQVTPEFLGVNVAFERVGNGQWGPPPLVNDWVRHHGAQGSSGTYQVIPSNVPYELVVGRRVYGARAFYLRSASEWRGKYQQALATAQGNFMLETHGALSDAPDLFPVETRVVEMFALGVALGFIVSRGDWYYFGLERRNDQIVVLYHTQGKVAHNWSPGTTRGRLLFELQSPRVLPQKCQLGQGRQVARDALKLSTAQLELLAEAFDEYHRAVGNDALKQQLEAYVRDVLDPQTATRPEFQEERDAILRRIDRIGR